MDDAKTRLQHLLGESAPDLNRIDPPQIVLLAELIHAAGKAQELALFEAIDVTIAALPRVLRAPARKILLG